jgi:glyoxylase-like metal-dependent hydrolase (beta-lactamase superfamily II)
MKYKSPLNHQRVLVLLACFLLFFGPLSGVRAEAPAVGTQAPGYYRMMLGQFEFTAIFDGSVDLDVKLLRNASETEIKSLLALMFVGFPKMQTSVNAYLINTGSKLILVDTGGGKMLGPTLGNILPNLRLSGYDPAQVDAVLLTHMHGDHIGGLLDAAGNPAFSNAVVYVSKPENDYWLSAAEEDKAPAGLQRIFKLARIVSSPYIAQKRWEKFDYNTPLFPGIKPVGIPGHTPGHSAFEISSGNQSLLIIGDLVHSMAVQFSRPDVALDFDVDPQKAVSTRNDMFKSVAEGKTLIAGMHLPFPGIGHLRADGNNSYAWVPVQYSPLSNGTQ